MFVSEEINKKLGQFLKKKRIEAGLSQKEVADKLKYSSSQFISNFERGLCAPPVKAMRVLILLYKMDSAEFTEYVLSLQEVHLRTVFHSKMKSKKFKTTG